ncbi:hypothetical protein BH10ACI1_BH10ACI1_07250 [soil metagenome]
MSNFKCKVLNLSILAFSISMLAACPATVPNINTNVNVSNNVNTNANTNANTNVANVNSNTAETSSTVETKEPDKYQAIVKLKFQTSGAQKLTIPGELQATVSRSGANRRMEYNLPNGEKVIYLDLNGKQLLILPQKKQYAELDKAALGFEIRSLMSPSQIVQQIKGMKGVERVGEEKYANREAVKYQYNSVTDTKSKAGNVETNTFIYIDKETSLPLHSETTTTSAGGNYQGITGLKIITDLSDIKTDVDAGLFAEPTDYAKVAPEQVKQQVDAIFNVAMIFLTQLMKSSQTTTSPTATP